MARALVALLLAAAPLASADTWAVVVAGSNTYGNYRHQADACHAYQVLVNGKVAADHIILMAYDDIASSPENPYPGQLFNKPTAEGVAAAVAPASAPLHPAKA